MKKQVLLILCLLSSFVAFSQTGDTTQHITPGRVNSPQQQQKPYVIMISVDAMRYDYAKKYNATHLLALAKSGVQATALLPSYPSITFPNHYTLVTGLYPSHTGIVCNKFYDRELNAFYSSKTSSSTEARWYGGTPLWVLAEQQQMLSAVYYWVGSDANIKNTNPTYYYKYGEQTPVNERIKTVVNWLKLPAEKRPHLINMYFPQVDHAGHHFGPESVEAHRAVLLIDSVVNELQLEVQKTGLDVNFVFVSDHGMEQIDNKHPLNVPAMIDTAKFRVTGEDVMVELYAKDPSAINNTYEALKKEANGKYKVYLSTNTPPHWHFNKANDRFNRIADILLIPNAPYVFVYGKAIKLNPGAHGYDPLLVPNMRATFYAWGPNLKTNMVVPPFKNVNIYPIVANILGLKITEPIDGDERFAKALLRK